MLTHVYSLVQKMVFISIPDLSLHDSYTGEELYIPHFKLHIIRDLLTLTDKQPTDETGKDRQANRKRQSGKGKFAQIEQTWACGLIFVSAVEF